MAQYRTETVDLDLAVPRRAIIKGLAGGAGAIVLNSFGLDAEATSGCKGVGSRCQSDADCCSGFCEPASRQCVALCDQGEGICGALGACAPGCSCYFVELEGPNGESVLGRACLKDPVGGTEVPGQECPGTIQCSSSAAAHGHCPCSGPRDCPKGYLCTASSCCSADSVCLPLCEPAA